MTNKPLKVLVTGCSKGFGLSFAARLAAEGYTVIAHVRTRENSQELETLTQSHQNLTILEADLGDLEQIQAMAAQVGDLDVLVNNAGYGLMGPLAELTPADVLAQFQTNVFAPLELTRLLLPALKRAPLGGTVINISSIASYLGLPVYGAYSATKVALNSLSMSLAAENEELSIVLIQPGPFKTAFRESAKRKGSAEVLDKLRSSAFGGQEDPQIVVDLLSECLKRKLAGTLPRFSELPVGKNSGFLRLVSRWLPVAWILAGMKQGKMKDTLAKA